MSLYIETFIRAPLEEVWRHTQTPELHERWDLRFSTITYLPHEGGYAPQRLRYATRLGFGLEIAGWGETLGQNAADGTRASALRFGSEDRRSLIREGSGYWRYESLGEGTRFLTGHDYRARGGALGTAVDRLVFRPLMVWATAWSFDRLRLWIESGVDPAAAARRALVHAIATLGVAFVWIWHGVVPKLLGPHADELKLWLDAGFAIETARLLTFAAGVSEVVFGLLVLCFARRRWPWVFTILGMLVATVGVLISSPSFVSAAFGPVSINLQLIALAVIGLLTSHDLPSARRCLRRAPKS